MEKLKQNIKEYQLNAGKTHTRYEQDNYNQYQNYLYKRALYGLSSINQEELDTMCGKKKQRIINVYKRAQVVLNTLKQQVTINYSNFIFKTLFPKSPITQFLLSETEIDEKFINILTFKDLNISKKDIITIFMSEGILPKNFLSLESPQNQLPRLKNECKA
jgi:fructose-bisphosphate aldolase class 1